MCQKFETDRSQTNCYKKICQKKKLLKEHFLLQYPFLFFVFYYKNLYFYNYFIFILHQMNIKMYIKMCYNTITRTQTIYIQSFHSNQLNMNDSRNAFLRKKNSIQVLLLI